MIYTKTHQNFTKEQWIDLTNQFKNKSEISKHLGISVWAVTNWLQKHNISYQDGRNVAHNKKNIPNKEELENLYLSMAMTDIAKHYGNVSNVTIKKWLKEYNIPFRSHSDTIKLIATPKIQKTNIKKYGTPMVPIPMHSKAELEILNYLNDELKCNFSPSRKILEYGYELDGYDENKKIAFEYCGLYYHCELNKINSNYHLNKLLQCRQKNIRLFTIYENEWKDRKKQVKAFLKSALNLNETIIYARKCKAEIIRDSSVLSFFNEYHIQGKPKSYDFCVVLKDKNTNEILSAMSFGKHHRQGNEDVLVLNRLCFKENIKIIGGSEKMLSLVPRDKKIISWSDNRWTEGGIYKKLGFVLEVEYPPSYDYVTTNGQLFKKQKMTRKNLKASPNQKEHERAKELGYYRIYDCGKKKWVLEK